MLYYRFLSNLPVRYPLPPPFPRKPPSFAPAITSIISLMRIIPQTKNVCQVFFEQTFFLPFIFCSHFVHPQLGGLTPSRLALGPHRIIQEVLISKSDSIFKLRFICPPSFVALLTSSSFLGVPFGLDGSHSTRPV